jgi:molybdopterin converting factor small subunit
MQVTVHYLAQLRRAAGCTTERVELDTGAAVLALLRRLGEVHGEPFRTLLLGAQGRPHPSLLLFVGDEPADLSRPLRDGDQLTILTPMAGGMSA